MYKVWLNTLTTAQLMAFASQNGLYMHQSRKGLIVNLLGSTNARELWAERNQRIEQFSPNS